MTLFFTHKGLEANGRSEKPHSVSNTALSAVTICYNKWSQEMLYRQSPSRFEVDRNVWVVVDCKMQFD